MLKTYAIVQNGVVVEYPVNPRVWVVSQDAYNIPEVWMGGQLDGKTYVACHMQTVPHKATENIVETTPVFNEADGLWVRQFNVVPASAQEIAERRERYLLGAVHVFNTELEKYQAKTALIANLSEAEQLKWREYLAALNSMDQQPEYPFHYTVPESPEITTRVNIGVERI